MNRQKKSKPRQLSLLSPAQSKFIGSDGWMVAFKPSIDGQMFTALGKLNEIYDALEQWIDEFPDYYSATIYSPNGRLHRTLKAPDKAR